MVGSPENVIWPATAAKKPAVARGPACLRVWEGVSALTFQTHPAQAFYTLRRFLLLTFPVFLACAHPAYGPPDEDRLAAAVTGDPSGAPKGVVQGCEAQQEGLGKARNGERSESERLRSYMEVVRLLTDRVDQNQKLVDRDPDIAYAGGTGSQSAADSRQVIDSCREMYGDARREFDELVHDLFSPLLVLDVQKHTRSARVSLPLLKSAVDELAPTDADVLRDKLNEADKVLQNQKRGG